jgi:hypothetical protein
MVHDLGENSHDRSIAGIEQLLQDTGNGIVELELCLRNAPELPEVTSIARHGDSLRRLTLDIGSAMGSWHITSGRLVYDERELQDLLEACVQLKQLAIALPDISLEYSTLSAKSPEFATYITSIAKPCKLEVLSLLSLPTDYTTIQSIGFFAAKDYALGRLAAEILPSTAHTRPHSRSLLSAPVSAPTATLGLVTLCLTSTQLRTSSVPRLSRSLSRTFRRTLGQTVFSATRGGISTLHRADSSILSRKKGGTGRARKILGRQKVRGRPLLLAVDGCECEECILGVE